MNLSNMVDASTSLWSAAGISREAGTVYTALIADGPSGVSTIARRTELHRVLVYRALKELQAAQLIRSEARGRRAQYIAESPELLRKRCATHAAERDRALDALDAAYVGEQRPHATVRVRSGARGLATVLEDLATNLDRGGTFYRYSSRKPGTDVERYVPKEYRTARDAKRLQQFVITNTALRNRPFQKRMDCFSKVVPAAQDPFEYNVA
ncbi:hypothetical protein HY632_00210, partial [Candidatus Uhrbacteria bacterium]|nr:hypothetical protein [Candidatus Uhrbacteria bacterium]